MREPNVLSEFLYPSFFSFYSGSHVAVYSVIFVFGSSGIQPCSRARRRKRPGRG